MWTPTQQTYRRLCVSLRTAYSHDRSQMFWARHRIKVEIYKYHPRTPREAVPLLRGCADQIAAFIEVYMKPDSARIRAYNEAVSTLPIREAKKYREEYLEKEREHRVWCRQRLKDLLEQRPPPPYPF